MTGIVLKPPSVEVAPSANIPLFTVTNVPICSTKIALSASIFLDISTRVSPFSDTAFAKPIPMLFTNLTFKIY